MHSSSSILSNAGTLGLPCIYSLANLGVSNGSGAETVILWIRDYTFLGFQQEKSWQAMSFTRLASKSILLEYQITKATQFFGGVVVFSLMNTSVHT